MEYDNLIYDFVNGSLEPAREDELFFMLSSNDDMRIKLKKLMAIENSVRNNAADIIPEPSLTASVFSSIGMTYMPGAAPYSAKNAGGAGYKKFIAPYKSIVFTGILSSLFTAALFFMIFRPDSVVDSHAQTVNASIQQDNPYTPKPENMPKPAIKAEISAANTQKVNNVRPVSAPTTKYFRVKESNDKLNGVVNVEEQNEPDTRISINDIPAAEPVEFAETQLSAGHTLDNPYEGFNIKAAERHKLDLTIEYRGNTDWHFPKPTISPEHYANFNNSSATVFYNISDEFSAGFEIRQENFFQHFEDKYKYYSQQPNFLSYGAAFRYTEKSLSRFLYPLTQVSLDATSVGGIGRFMLGFNAAIYDDVSLVFGAEGSLLLYDFDGEYFQSKKIGINFGFSYKI